MQKIAPFFILISSLFFLKKPFKKCHFNTIITFDIMSINETHGFNKIKTFANIAKQFCESQYFDTEHCFLIDMSLPSGKNRFFVYDFNTDSIALQGNVCHGKKSIINGSNKLRYSNELFSNCTSLGKYKIGARGKSKYGLGFNYVLHGLDKTNNNAFNRIVVLHSKDDVANHEIYPITLVTSSGCPSVSNQFLSKLDTVLINKEKPVLLWIFE